VIRTDRHTSNAFKIAKTLEKNENVELIKYPLLESSNDYKLAMKYLPMGGSGVISFGVKGGVEEGKKFINSLKLASLVVHVGDIRTHVLHPASMTHRQLSKEDQLAAGIKENQIRLSVGIENADEIINEIGRASCREREREGE